MRRLNKPLVTVVIPTYKRPKKLERAVQSVLNQTYENLEIIVVNDDPREEELLEIKDDRIKVINHSENKGGAAARNTGIRNSHGKYVALLDDDDKFIPKKIKLEVEVMEKLPEDYVASFCWSYAEEGEIRKTNSTGDFIYKILSLDRGLHLGSSSIFVIREVVSSIGGFDERFPRHQDLELLIRLRLEGKIKMLRQPLFVKSDSDHPSAEKVLESKKLFLEKFESLINSVRDDKKINMIYGAHWLQVSRFFFREGKFKIGFKYLKKSLSYIPPLQIDRYSNLRVPIYKGVKEILKKW